MNKIVFFPVFFFIQFWDNAGQLRFIPQKFPYEILRLPEWVASLCNAVQKWFLAVKDAKSRIFTHFSTRFLVKVGKTAK